MSFFVAQTQCFSNFSQLGFIAHSKSISTISLLFIIKNVLKLTILALIFIFYSPIIFRFFCLFFEFALPLIFELILFHVEKVVDQEKVKENEKQHKSGIGICHMDNTAIFHVVGAPDEIFFLFGIFVIPKVDPGTNLK